MKYLITGCAGFIGANYTKYVLDKHADALVIGVDALTYAANLSALECLKKNPRFKFYQCDICDRLEMREIIKRERPDVIVNFAAESHVDRSIDNSAPFVMTNVVGTGVLLDLALEFSLHRFHQISTDEVYGPSVDGLKFTEDDGLHPSSPYSASKAAADLLALSYHRTHGLPVSISRSSNNYGKFQHVEKFIPRVIDFAKREEPIPIYGDGTACRDWLHVDDNCVAIDMIVRDASSSNGAIYNLSTGVLTKNIDLAKMILSSMGRDDSGIFLAPDRKGHDIAYMTDSSRMMRKFGWTPEHKIHEDIHSIVKLYM